MFTLSSSIKQSCDRDRPGLDMGPIQAAPAAGASTCLGKGAKVPCRFGIDVPRDLLTGLSKLTRRKIPKSIQCEAWLMRLKGCRINY